MVLYFKTRLKMFHSNCRRYCVKRNTIGCKITTNGSLGLENPPGRIIPGSAHSTRYVKPDNSGTRMTRVNQRTDSPESRLEGNGLEVFTLFCSNLLKAFKIQNNLTIRQYYMQAYF